MTREEKQAFVAEFQERLGRAEAFFLTDFTGLNVQAMTSLRSQLKKSGAEYLVVKNRLVKRALEDTAIPDISRFLEGPTGVVFGDDDVVAAAKTVTDFAKENGDRPVFKVGVLDTTVLDAAQIDRVATLPPREELLSQVAGVLSAPMSALVGAMSGKLQEMAGLVDALRGERESE
ncbi:MAG: 50S ribosomal protein L10 [Gemmatimonadetes bacterium]|nr:50S ribosomal protein L10 [Gemmatimonadota bacterium]MYA64698.1 50S ribosomal protein L10 [Gemmatimonadota bacterium]MYB99306.1 50S ribosomal protein L10 [Gemmatimonadota bacterium]MYH52393.1 50S ribosomal protein L10 [Gemmatimonadota bacterium]MYK67857.1 50S ribosomal protein L10 [Gemmatimonadota bacterium]